MANEYTDMTNELKYYNDFYDDDYEPHYRSRRSTHEEWEQKHGGDGWETSQFFLKKVRHPQNFYFIDR